MTEFWFYYSIVMPVIVATIALVAYRLHERDLDRKIRNRRPPGE